jgi:hypothetical protein
VPITPSFADAQRYWFAAMLVWCVAIIAPTSAAALSPGDFEHAWTIVLTSPVGTQRIVLPEEVIVATHHRWIDAVVLDARNQPIPFGVGDGRAGASLQLPVSTCSVRAESSSVNLVFRCPAPKPVERAYGARIDSGGTSRLHAPLKVAVRDQDGRQLAMFDGEWGWPGGPALRGTPIAFDGPHYIEALEFEMFIPNQRVVTAQIAEPFSNVASYWHAAHLVHAEPDSKTFIYAVDFAARAYAVRFRLLVPLAASSRLILGDCQDPDCKIPGNNTGEADALSLGPDNPSFPVPLTPFGSDRPYLRLTSNEILQAAPDLEIGWTPPGLVFSASGTAPYTLAVGIEKLPSSARYGFNAQGGIPIGQFAEAALAPYSAATNLTNRIIDLAGPLLLLFVLGIGLTWALRRPRKP